MDHLERSNKYIEMQSVWTPGQEWLTTALFQCYLDYSCSSWNCSLGKGMIKKLQEQNKVVIFVLDLGPRSRINCDILDKVNMLSVRRVLN